MMKNRKVAALLLTAFVTSAFAGCGGNDTLVIDKTNETTTKENMDKNDKSDKEKTEKKGYYFTYKDVNIAINDDMKKVYESIGEKADIKETPSCKYTGNDKNYTFNGFSVTAFADEKKDAETIYVITLESDLVKTNEGISVGDSVTDIADKYGEPEEPGVYKYKKDKMYIQFSVKNDMVSSITYTID